MKKKTNPLNISEPMSIEESIAGIAAEFVAQFTDEEIASIANLSPEDCRKLLQEVAVSNLEFATGILPGRPSRPRKPNV